MVQQSDSLVSCCAAIAGHADAAVEQIGGAAVGKNPKTRVQLRLTTTPAPLWVLEYDTLSHGI